MRPRAQACRHMQGQGHPFLSSGYMEKAPMGDSQEASSGSSATSSVMGSNGQQNRLLMHLSM